MKADQKETLERVLGHLERAQKVIAFSGAGISEESGIPTFRGSGGLWNSRRIKEVATPEAFERDPKLVWNFYLERRRDVGKAKPNAAHLAIAGWQKRFPFVGVVTQNIDGLHRKAGSLNLQELHGNIWKSRCVRCETIRDDEVLEASELRYCEDCRGLLRPHIVWFGEPLDPKVIHTSVQWMRDADMVFVVGTSGVVEPAASLVRDAKFRGAFVVEVNVTETALTPAADVSLFGKSGEIFSKWFNR